jgi:hypothetical protein
VLGDEQAALRLAMKVPVLLRDEVRLWREELRFLEDSVSGKFICRRGRPMRHAAASYARAASSGEL